MNKEEAIEGIKRHLEAILSLTKECGIDDYLNMAIVGGRIMLNNDYGETHAEDGLGVNLYYKDGEWSEV